MTSGINKLNEEYKISGDHFHKIFDGIALGFALCELILDKNGNPKDYRFLRINPAFEKQTGLKIPSTVGKTVKEIYPDIEQSWIDRYGSVVIDNKPIHFIDYNHNTDKTYSVNAHSFSENKFVMFFDDITKITVSEKNLGRSEKQYEQLFNSMMEMFQAVEIIYDEDGNAIDYVYLQVNRAFQELVNKKRDELIGKRAKEIFGVVEDHWLRTYAKVDKSGNTESYVNYGAELDKYYQIHAWKIDKGQVAIVFTDITKSKKSELALQESLRLNKNYIEILNDAQRIANIGNWEWNILTNEVKWSDSMYELLGYVPKSIKPSYTLALKHVHEDDKERYEKKLKESISKKIEYHLENKIIKTNNSVIDVISRGTCFLDADNDLIRMIGTVQDITAQKLMEEKLLEHQKLTAMGEMAASIAHDFNNSLQAMMGNLEIIELQNGVSGKSLERLRSIKSTITDAASRVHALQHFTDTNNVEKETTQFQLNTVIEDSIKQSRPLWKDTMEKEGLVINIVRDYGEIPKIDFNKGELKTAIHNLIKNSIEAMPEGGDIIIKTGVGKRKVFMTFSDTGQGMDQKTKSRIFEPFYTTKGFKAGRGLGMSGVYWIMKKYGGSIRVKSSELGKGTTIAMEFPINTGVVKDDDKEHTIKDIVSRRILWVDDEDTIRENGCDVLELLGHECNSVNNGKCALQFLKVNPCDIVITDIGMPHMNGWQLADAIRKTIGNKIRIVIVSGWEIDDNTKNQHGVDFVLQKPFNIESLRSIIEL
jgi:PAS domain S-box-containing protein